MKTSHNGREFIKLREGLRLKAYQCSAGVWTIGYGHTSDVKPNDVITQHQAEAVFDVDVDTHERGVVACLDGYDVTQDEFDALVSFAFNEGAGALARSKLLKLLKAGDRAGAADQFLRWIYAGGKVEDGLVKRRLLERALFLSEPAP